MLRGKSGKLSDRLPQFYVSAIIGLIGTAASVGSQAYGASQAGKGVAGLKPEKIPISDLTQLNLPDVSTAYGSFLNQENQFGPLQGMISTENTLANKDWQSRLTQIDPNVLKSVAALGGNTLQELQGQLPTDVQNQILRDTSFQALKGGFADSGMARNLTARDLGLTSLNLMGTGATNLGTDLSALAALNPSNATLSSILFSPQQILQRSDNQQQYNTDLLNQVAFYNRGAQQAAQMTAALGANAQSSALAGLGQNIGNLLNSKGVQSNLSTLFGGPLNTSGVNTAQLTASNNVPSNILDAINTPSTTGSAGSGAIDLGTLPGVGTTSAGTAADAGTAMLDFTQGLYG